MYLTGLFTFHRLITVSENLNGQIDWLIKLTRRHCIPVLRPAPMLATSRHNHGAGYSSKVAARGAITWEDSYGAYCPVWSTVKSVRATKIDRYVFPFYWPTGSECLKKIGSITMINYFLELFCLVGGYGHGCLSTYLQRRTAKRFNVCHLLGVIYYSYYR